MEKFNCRKVGMVSEKGRGGWSGELTNKQTDWKQTNIFLK